MAREKADDIKEFGARLVRAIADLIGIRATAHIVQSVFASDAVSFDEESNVFFRKNVGKPALKELTTLLGERLERNFGHDFTDNLFRTIYTDIFKDSGDREDADAAAILAIVPEQFLENERLRSLSKQELEKVVLERTRELRNTNVSLEQTVAERTKELTVANKNLEGANANLEDANRRLQELDEIKSEFIRIAAHQLRTPMSAIKWTFYTLLDGDVGALTEEQRSFIIRGSMANDRMVALVNDLLNVSRIEEGKFDYVFTEGDIMDFLREKISETSLQAKNSGVALSLTSDGLIPPLLFDAEKLTLAVNNLLDNAIRYTPAGGKVDVTVAKKDSYVIVAIHDTGVGIPHEDFPRLFSKFFRSRNVVTLQTDGSGLGLYIARNILKEHKGDIEVVSEEGKGTTFSLLLPLAPAPASTSAAVSEKLSKKLRMRREHA